MAKDNRDFEDDGRVVAPMNVDGMPWYDNRQPDIKSEGSSGNTIDYKSMSKEEKKEYNKETRFLIFGILKYVIPILAIFIVVFFLVILFLTRVWR